jgi:hypothetical protein
MYILVPWKPVVLVWGLLSAMIFFGFVGGLAHPFKMSSYGCPILPAFSAVRVALSNVSSWPI